eukprot:9249450-Heterocapsa_arctica.AAC.1
MGREASPAGILRGLPRSRGCRPGAPACCARAPGRSGSLHKGKRVPWPPTGQRVACQPEGAGIDPFADLACVGRAV